MSKVKFFPDLVETKKNKVSDFKSVDYFSPKPNVKDYGTWKVKTSKNKKK